MCVVCESGHTDQYGQRQGNEKRLHVRSPSRPYHEATLRIGTEPPPALMSAPLIVPPGATVDTDHAVVIAATATMIAMVMIFRISSFSP